VSLTNGKCSGSGRRAGRSWSAWSRKENMACRLHYRYPKLLCTLRSLLKLGWLDIRCLASVSELYALGEMADVHRSMIWFLQMAQLSTTISQAHRATAFHYHIIRRFYKHIRARTSPSSLQSVSCHLPRPHQLHQPYPCQRPSLLELQIPKEHRSYQRPPW
jgi:hypothetical protein